MDGRTGGDKGFPHSPEVKEKESLKLPQVHRFQFQRSDMEMTVIHYQVLKVSGESKVTFRSAVIIVSVFTYFQHTGKFPSEHFEHFTAATLFPGSQNQPGKQICSRQAAVLRLSSPDQEVMVRTAALPGPPAPGCAIASLGTAPGPESGPSAARHLPRRSK